MDLEEWIRRYGMDNCVSADEVLTYLKAPTYGEDVYFCHFEAMEGRVLEKKGYIS